MNTHCDLLIVGGSARAAACSALRAGLTPLCIDRFGDADLKARCEWRSWSELRRAANEVPHPPWLFTGGMENRPGLVRSLSRGRPIWGNNADVLAIVRSPVMVCKLLREAGLPCPEVRRHPSEVPVDGLWLKKPLDGSGGTGIRFLSPRTHDGGSRYYFQRYVEGEPCAAAYIANGRSARLLGVTRQMIGESWLHAAPFQYCGSVGPRAVNATTYSALEKLGNTLTAGSGLRGLFGVDFILRDDGPWTVEVNPRYTASMEVVEFATGSPVMMLHRQVFDATAPPRRPSVQASGCFGKAILFAETAFVFPHDGPWSSVLQELRPIDEYPAFSDVPSPGTLIAAKAPVLSFFACAENSAVCKAELRRIALDLDRWLYRR